jgi:sugar-specific transcriptional regulator TrmB
MVSRIQSDLISDIQLHNELIRLLGLTQNEARIYCAMFSGGQFTAGELSSVTDIHRSRIYDNLRGLEAKKLIEQTSTDPLRFRVVTPKNAVADKIETLEIEYRTHTQEVMALGLKLDEIYRNQRKTETPLDTRTIPLNESITELNRILDSARERVWVSKNTSGGIVDWFVLKSQMDRLSQLGVDIRFLTTRSVRAGYTSRILPKITLSYAIIDNTSLTFFLSKNENNEGLTMISKNSDYVGFLEKTFLVDWEMGDVDIEDKK